MNTNKYIEYFITSLGEEKQQLEFELVELNTKLREAEKIDRKSVLEPDLIANELLRDQTKNQITQMQSKIRCNLVKARTAHNELESQYMTPTKSKWLDKNTTTPPDTLEYQKEKITPRVAPAAREQEALEEEVILKTPKSVIDIVKRSIPLYNEEKTALAVNSFIKKLDKFFVVESLDDASKLLVMESKLGHHSLSRFEIWQNQNSSATYSDWKVWFYSSNVDYLDSDKARDELRVCYQSQGSDKKDIKTFVTKLQSINVRITDHFYKNKDLSDAFLKGLDSNIKEETNKRVQIERNAAARKLKRENKLVEAKEFSLTFEEISEIAYEVESAYKKSNQNY